MRNPGLIPHSVQADDALLERLIDILRANHRGQGRAVNSADLVLELYGPISPRGADRTIRDAVEKINNAGGLVCSSPASGYWWAASLEDGLPAAQKKLHRAEVQVVNAKRLANNLEMSFGQQESA